MEVKKKLEMSVHKQENAPEIEGIKLKEYFHH